MQATQACISIWSFLATSTTHREALVRVLIRIQFDTTTLSNGLLHKLTIDRVSCIVFSNDNLLSKGIDHTQPLYITIGCLSHQVPYVLLDNGLTLNICSISVIVALGFGLVNFSLFTQIVRAYDNTRKEVMGTLMLGIQVGPVTFFYAIPSFKGTYVLQPVIGSTLDP